MTREVQDSFPITRREFLLRTVRAAVVAPSLLFTACSNRPSTIAESRPAIFFKTPEPPTQPENAKVLQKEIEEKFGIRLDVVNNGYTRESSKIPVPYFWAIDHLELLTLCLPQLPDHFHAPDPQKGSLTISLGVQSSLGERPREAVLNHFLDFTLINKRRAFETLAHELVHTQDPVYTVNPPRFILGVEANRRSPWYDKVEEKLGESFANFSLGLKNEIATKVNILQKIVDKRMATSAEREKFEFYRSFQYSLGLTKNNLGATFDPVPTEFVAVLSENYVYGKALFQQRYREFLNSQQLNGIYTFVKDDIFKGQEYEKFPI